MFRRETIIALRARHQAHRIASDILHPPINLPPGDAPPSPVIPVMLRPFYQYRKRRKITALQVALAILVWTVAIECLNLLYRSGGRPWW